MPITLAEAKNNTQMDYDPFVIDEFRKESPMLDLLTFDDAVNPSPAGGTMDYGYRRLKTQATASTREINKEYTPQNVTTEKKSVTLAVMGGSFEVDRVVARNLGTGAGAAVELNLAQKIKSTVAEFNDQVVNGDVAVDANGFDGLDKALTGSSTEVGGTTVTDWSDLDTVQSTSHRALDTLDDLFDLLNGPASIVLGNRKALSKVRAIARRIGMYNRDPFEGLLDRNGRPVVRETYGNVTFVDAGAKAGTATDVIPVESRTVGGNTVTGLTDLYAIRLDLLDGFHGVSTVGSQLVETWLPDFSTAKAVKTGEVELGPVAVALKATKAAAVLRNIKVQ
ncbi:major capsid protein [Leucobacter luti]|uniref:major capsid protein n=1 Tax=Leucobacter luti TaxID=340320 RepID=UPI003D06833B